MKEPLPAAPPLATFRNETAYPFCPGCGHGPALDHLNRALVSLGLDPRQVVIVSDIGCSGLADQYFATNAFHGLHGRSLTYASGIKLARPELKVIVIMGDGGTGIGGAHLLSAARRNLGLTLLVLNNFNFGMTGGQHSATTPTAALTATTPRGNLERPLDVCATAAVNGAGYVYRGTSFDPDLAERIAEAVAGEGFAVLDVWDLCTAHFVPRNKASRKTLTALFEELGLEAGVLARSQRPEYAGAYRAACADLAGRPVLAPEPLEARFESPLEGRFRFVAAGSAGAKVRSAVRLAARAAILSGLWATQKDDYPITVKTGHSVSELVLDRREIHYTGIERPDAVLVLSEEGLRKVEKHLARMDAAGDVFVLPPFAGVATPARVHVLDPSRVSPRIGPTALSLWALANALERLGLLSAASLEAAASLGGEALREARLETLRAARARA